MKVKGKVYFIGDTKSVSASFKTREIVLITEDIYPQTIPFQLTQDKCDLADQIKINETVEVSINLRGREWRSPTGEVKFYCTLEIWTINSIGMAPQAEITDVVDDLPF